jgi:regulator of cell morphogenesis and NO signaling
MTEQNLLKALPHLFNNIQMQSRIDPNKTVSEIVRENYRTSDVFKRHQINYCCGGNISLRAVCEARQLNLSSVLRDLEESTHIIQLPSTIEFDNWSPDFLIDYILNIHHAYIKKVSAPLLTLIINFSQGHREKYPHMLSIAETFEGLHFELEEQTGKEELRLFPYLRQIYSTHKKKESYGGLFVRTLGKTLLSHTDSEQKRLAIYLKQLRELTNDYSFLSSACTNHQVIYNKLKEFDADLVQHKHLENNILFPKVVQMELELLQQ